MSVHEPGNNPKYMHKYTPAKYAMDVVLGFLVMIKTVLQGNPKWTLFEIIHTWSLSTFDEDIDDEPEFNNHTICRILVEQIKRGHVYYRVVLPRAFIPLYKEVLADTWWNTSDRRVRKITYIVADMFGFEPYNYTLKQ